MVTCSLLCDNLEVATGSLLIECEDTTCLPPALAVCMCNRSMYTEQVQSPEGGGAVSAAVCAILISINQTFCLALLRHEYPSSCTVCDRYSSVYK